MLDAINKEIQLFIIALDRTKKDLRLTDLKISIC
jgi:hypothetical protein